MRKLIATGNELVALASYDVGGQAFAGYPITPSSETMHELSHVLPRAKRAFIQMEDEISAICAAIGFSIRGKKALTVTSGPGFSLMSEQIGFAQGSEIPVAVVNVMRGGPSTGLPTHTAQGDVLQARNPTHGDVRMIVLCPGNLAECYTETVRAFNLAERFMQCVVVLLDETLGHMSADVEIPELVDVQKSIINRKTDRRTSYKPYDVPDDQPAVLNPFFTGSYYHITGLAHDSMGFPSEDPNVCEKLSRRLFRKVDAHLDEIELCEKYMVDDAEYLIICYGSVSLSAREAIRRMRKEGVKVGMFRPITLWPSPDKRMLGVTKKFDAENILVVELNLGQYLREVERSTQKRPPFLGKANGRAISPEEIIEKMRSMHHEL